MIHDIEPFDEFTGPNEAEIDQSIEELEARRDQLQSERIRREVSRKLDQSSRSLPYAQMVALATLSKSRAIRRRMSETDINDCGDGFFPEDDGRAA